MPKRKRRTNKGKTYSKGVTLYPLTDEQALLGLLKTPPIKRQQKKKTKYAASVTRALELVGAIPARL